jgi:hypothetical protein
MTKHGRFIRVAAFALLLPCVHERAARASPYKDALEPSADVTHASSPALVTDLRFSTLIRSNEGYFSQAGVFGFPVPTVAAGVAMTLGVEILPRVTVFGAGNYFGQGARREAFGKMMLTSESLLLGARVAVLRTTADQLMAQLEVWGGGGKYWMRETFYDQLLSAKTYVSDSNGAGFATGIEGSFHVAAFRLVAGYAYHYAPAAISNEVGGTVHAGGHEIDIGVGVRL